MTQARFTLTTSSMTLPEAQALAETIDAHPIIDATAITINETDETHDLWNVVFYFSEIQDAEQARSQIEIATTIADIPDENWVRKSLQGLAPISAGRFFLHGSHDRDQRPACGTALEIDAGTAFGTGHHGTTTGCLIALDHLLKSQNPKRVFDLGCGTGVLAIAAAKVTHRKVLATDIDAEAVRVSRANSRLNHLSPALLCQTAAGLHHPIIRSHAPFDLIFANILARPLVALAQGLTQLLPPGGVLVLSGLTVDQLRWIKACYRARGLVHLRSIVRGQWVALVMQKPRGKRTSKRRSHSPARGLGWVQDL